MKTIKLLTNVSLLLFLILLFPFCKNDNSNIKQTEAIKNSYMSRNLEFSNRLKDKNFILEELTGCSLNYELKFIMIYRKIDCSTCIKSCRDELVSKENFHNIAILKLGFSEMEDSLSFIDFEEIFYDESENILDAYGYFPTPVIFEIENDKIKGCHFCY